MILDYLSNKSESKPIWFMRQAGRYLPEYRVLRSKHKSFLDMCYNPKVASEISLQPIRRFGFDAIILFSDILVVPHAMGFKVDFKENIGPVLDILDLNKRNKFNSIDKFSKQLSPIYETLKILSIAKGKKTLIGFCGSPFTVLTYLIEGGSSKDHFKTKVSILNKKTRVKHIIQELINYSLIYLEEQIKAGAEVLQIFESWAGIPDKDNYEDLIIKPNKKIVEYVKKKYPKVKTICFTKGNQKHLPIFLEQVPCDVISVQRIEDCDIVKYCKEKNIAIQGNLDPVDLYIGGDYLKKKVKKILQQFREVKHIFNLSHGIHPTTPLENVYKTIEYVKEIDVTRES